MKYTLSPLLREKTSDIEPLAKDLLNYDGINFLTGKAKVGKTALLYKLMHCWEKQGLKTIIYTVDKRNNKTDAARLILLSLLMNEVKISENCLLIIDDFGYVSNNTYTAYNRILIYQLKWIKHKYQSKIILTVRSKREMEESMNNLVTEHLGRINYRFINLERPAYIGGDIKEFGECKVWMGENKQ